MAYSHLYQVPPLLFECFLMRVICHSFSQYKEKSFTFISFQNIPCVVTFECDPVHDTQKIRRALFILDVQNA